MKGKTENLWKDSRTQTEIDRENNDKNKGGNMKLLGKTILVKPETKNAGIVNPSTNEMGTPTGLAEVMYIGDEVTKLKVGDFILLPDRYPPAYGVSFPEELLGLIELLEGHITVVFDKQIKEKE